MGLGQIKRVARRTRFQLRFVTKSTNSAVQLCSLFQCNRCNPMPGVGALLLEQCVAIWKLCKWVIHWYIDTLDIHDTVQCKYNIQCNWKMMTCVWQRPETCSAAQMTLLISDVWSESRNIRCLVIDWITGLCPLMCQQQPPLHLAIVLCHFKDWR